MIPVQNAIEAFLVIFNNLPVSLLNFISLALGLFFIVGVIRIVLRL